MFKLFSISLLLAALILPTTVVFVGQVSAQEDPVEDEVMTDEDAAEDSKVETEEDIAEEETTSPTGKDAEEEEKPQGIRTSADAETAVLFTDFPDKQLPAGELIHVLVGFHNKGEKDFIVETIDASFRYPQDYSYHIQNFTGTQYNRIVSAGQEVSFKYSFHPHESYGGRPFGVTILMMYKDADGNQFGAGVFNETVTFKEVDDSFDGETFFLYVMLAAIALLVIFGLNYAFGNSKFRRSITKATTEYGTQSDKNNVDYDWLPKETTTEFNSKNSPRRSPRQRRVKRNTGSGEE